jgi:hypothetical protein
MKDEIDRTQGDTKRDVRAKWKRWLRYMIIRPAPRSIPS